MDPVTHILSGLAVAHAGFRQRIGRPAILAVAGGAIAPDLDSAMGLWDQFAAIKYHRGLTHSLFGAVLLALLVAWPIYRWGAHKRYRDLVVLVYLGILVHIGLDLITSFGTRVFSPFSDARLALDLAFIVDPILFSPFRWMAVAEAPGRLYQATVTPWPGTPVDLRLYTQAPGNVYVGSSDAVMSVRLFRSFARFLWTRHFQRGEEHIVEYRDLRFGAEHTANDMVLRVAMDTSGVVKSVDFNHRF